MRKAKEAIIIVLWLSFVAACILGACFINAVIIKALML